MALIGYARVSTVDQNPALQLDALQTAGCDPVFSDHASGAREKRPDLDRCLGYLRAGDTLVVWRLDRLGRSLRHLVTLVADLGARGIGFRSLTENIDTTTAGGRLIFHVMAALAEFEREIIKERSIAGVAAARARGRKPGRPRTRCYMTGSMTRRCTGCRLISSRPNLSWATVYGCPPRARVNAN